MNIRHRLFLIATAVLLAVATLTPTATANQRLRHLSRGSQNSMALAFTT